MSDTESERDVEKDDMGELQDTDDDFQSDDSQEVYPDQPVDYTEAQEQQEYFTAEYIVPEQERITSNMMTKYEFANIVGTRAQYIDRSGVHFADLANQDVGHLNAMDIAVLEIKQRKCPLLIKRHIDKKHIEVFSPNEMVLPKVNIAIHY